MRMTINEQIEQEVRAINQEIGDIRFSTKQEEFALSICRALTDLVSVVNNLEARISALEGHDE